MLLGTEIGTAKTVISTTSLGGTPVTSVEERRGSLRWRRRGAGPSPETGCVMDAGRTTSPDEPSVSGALLRKQRRQRWTNRGEIMTSRGYVVTS